MGHKHNKKGKFNKKGGKKQKNGGGSNIGHGNFDDLMKGFIIMTDQDREKNAVSDANNFLIPLIEELYPALQDIGQKINSQVDTVQKKIKTDDHQEQKQQENEQESEQKCDSQQENQIDEKQEQEEEQKPVENENENEIDQQEEQEQNNEEESESEEQEQKQDDNQTQEKPNEQTTIQTANDKLDQELNALKQQKDKLLYNVNTDVRCTVFLKVNSKLMNDIDVTHVVENIMHKVHQEKTTLTRFCHRMYPAEYAFRADTENLKKYMEQLIKERIQTEAPSSWMLECKVRNNSKFNRKNVLDIVNGLMPKIHFVDYKVPFYTIIVDICHNLMCLSILKNYYDYKKYSVKVNPQLNNQKDYSHLNQNKQPPKQIIPVTEEQLKEIEQKQEEQKAQLRAEVIKNDDDDIDLI
ncbi:THUMP domain protein, putative (macronuclear) [Tetrahymena thermophila SB210]|uniref:THUMP domain protein, putative n=1 Tax=Tetrahymena thermophila (strain SB210) TaxID=312017 RepID=I7LUX7_TETTS|nr:THUMP domain protein, putative [Tetrahymena thermophila SB210]EAR96266.2 THUMP domain protein, putative [Tetrahymena thermophila SB210]|eukprot:XP_001016511.2 THUMP domain protein, putative [Tetrahymena thermophila SB210]